MKKRIVLWVLPILLCLSIFGVFYSRHQQEHEVERWLQQQAQDLKQIEILDGIRNRSYSWNSFTITNADAIQKFINSLHASGSLTDTKPGQIDDGVLGDNRSYFITLVFKSPEHKPEYLVINPSNDRLGISLLNRRSNDFESNSINIIGCADMSSQQFEEFKKTLDSIRRQ